MLGTALLLMILLTGGQQVPASTDDEELGKAAQSPFLIARYVQTHGRIEWKPLWKALGIGTDGGNPHLPVCEGPGQCTAESIPFGVPESFQIILRLNHEISDFAVFLRFQQAGPLGQDKWKFTGYYQPNVKYFRPEHKLLSFGGKPFLLLTEQGISGTGVYAKWESIFDLSGMKFEPVFSYVEEGHALGCYLPADRTVHGFLASFESGPRDILRIHYLVEYTNECAGDPPIRLGRTEANTVYARSRVGKFRFDPKLSSAPEKEIQRVYQDFDSSMTKQEFLHYNFENLKRIASGPKGRTKTWLSRFLNRCKETPEKQELERLLAVN
jgi:hypothetical protein